jgi:starch-binding outer membrane protein, SusD/RagB family
MKLKYSLPAFLLIWSFSTSCSRDYLTKLPQGAVDSTALQSAVGVNVLLIGAYSALSGQQSEMASFGGGNAWACSPSNWLFGSVAGGDAHKGSDGTDQIAFMGMAAFTVTASNDMINDKWKAVYEGITRCNNVLKVLPKVTDMSPDEMTNVMAQARFLRGHYYFELKKLFNMVPWIDETTTDLKQPNNVDIWPKIEADFQFAYNNLPDNQDDIGRANKWAAGAYLAKTYLYEKKYSDAEPIFTDVINEGQTTNGLPYDLTPSFEDNRRPAYESQNAEAVFVVEMAANVGTGEISSGNQGDALNFPYGGNLPFSCCGFFQPSIDLVNSFRTDANGLPYLDDYNAHAVKNDQGLTSGDPFTPDAGNLDPRLDWTTGRRGIPYLDYGVNPGQDWVRLQSYAGPNDPIKNVWWNADTETDADNSQWAPGTAINVFIIRFADVLLMAAEVKAQLNKFDEAEDLVNRVRDRMINNPGSWVHTYKDPNNPQLGFTNTPAANYKIGEYPAGAFSSQDFALKAIYFERKLELAMEGIRYFDISRWGTAASTMNAFFAYEGQYTTDIQGATFTANKNEYMPIPQIQIDETYVNGAPTLTQNPGYK